MTAYDAPCDCADCEALAWLEADDDARARAEEREVDAYLDGDRPTPWGSWRGGA